MNVVAEPKGPMDISFEQRARQLQALQEQEEKARADRKKSTFDDWAQLNRKNIVHLIKAAQVNPTALQVLLFIIEHMNKMNALVCSYKVLQEQLGLSQATVARSVKYLKDNGFIAIYKSGSSNVYVINPDLVWTSYGDKVEYCKFPAMVMLSASEQEELDQSTKIKFDLQKVMEENE